MSEDLISLYDKLKNESNEIYIKETRNLSIRNQNLIKFILFNFDIDILELKSKNKDYEFYFNMRNRLIQNLSTYLNF